ncbi:DUF4328 domain-containing protein [Sphingosinicella sp. LHD-64]|uniref:DUF4328 domain-containing protein n=1 Tax=Sphingosinicella sp. LHD-64 TaxID=3072139 RepID=UPI00280CCE34|nr:DUF4328 domain-containing protein [Sphingosinicella sp. LHD-64]MDQ8756860.1 DUF4328 domain-containing protein [Sphingosinicella sp. LHD-64]
MAAQAPAWPFRYNRTAAQWTRWLALAQAALAAGAAAWAFAAPAGLKPGADDPFILLETVQLLFFIAGAIVVARWLYVAGANARAMGATDMMGSPAWAIAWYIVPLANLFMPFVAMRELWRASADPRDWQAASAPAILILWWLCWLASNIAGTVAFRLEWEGDATMLGAVGTAQTISNALFVPAALLFAHIVARVQAMQDGQGPAQLFR